MICCVCGFAEHHGVIYGDTSISGLIKRFMCERCCLNLSIYAPFKLIPGFHIMQVGRGRKAHFERTLIDINSKVGVTITKSPKVQPTRKYCLGKLAKSSKEIYREG